MTSRKKTKRPAKLELLLPRVRRSTWDDRDLQCAVFLRPEDDPTFAEVICRCQTTSEAEAFAAGFNLASNWTSGTAETGTHAIERMLDDAIKFECKGIA